MYGNDRRQMEIKISLKIKIARYKTYKVIKMVYSLNSIVS